MRPAPDDSTAREGRITPEDMDLQGRTQRVCAAVTERPSIRQRLRGEGLGERLNNLLRTDGVRGLERAGVELVNLRNAGATEAECRQYETFVRELVDDLFSGSSAPDLQLVRRERMEADCADDRLTHLHAIDGQHAVSHRELAAAYRKAAAANLTAARAHEREDRMQRRSAVTTVTRLMPTSPRAS